MGNTVKSKLNADYDRKYNIMFYTLKYYIERNINNCRTNNNIPLLLSYNELFRGGHSVSTNFISGVAIYYMFDVMPYVKTNKNVPESLNLIENDLYIFGDYLKYTSTVKITENTLLYNLSKNKWHTTEPTNTDIKNSVEQFAKITIESFSFVPSGLQNIAIYAMFAMYASHMSHGFMTGGSNMTANRDINSEDYKELKKYIESLYPNDEFVLNNVPEIISIFLDSMKV